jgi:AcrR family transcriptional regulator
VNQESPAGRSARAARGDATRRQIVATATAMFTAHGYEATSIEAVLTRTGVSRGALYHHFDGKQALYRAVLEAVEARVAEVTAEASRGLADPLEALRAGGRAWIDLADDPQVRRIVLIDAPAVLGWQAWREIDSRHAFGQLKAGLRNAARAGRLRPELAETMAHVLLAALLELALLVARADDVALTRRHARAALDALLDGLIAAAPGAPHRAPRARR